MGVEKVAKASSDLRSSIRELEKGEKAGQMLLSNRQNNTELEHQEFWYKREGNKAKLRRRGRKYDYQFHNEQQLKKVCNINLNKISSNGKLPNAVADDDDHLSDPD